jgi:quercetin dioxygenase-like cupin family protein
MIRKDLFYCDEKKVPSDYFVGNVVIREAYNEVNSDDQELYFVEFSNGAFTSLHFHESEQFLVPTYGKGFIGEIQKESLLDFCSNDVNIQLLEVGQVVSIPPNKLHFHGALPKQNFSHIAFRKMFSCDLSNDNNKDNLYHTQTKWMSDLLAKQFSNDQPMVDKKYQEITDILKRSLNSKIESY